MSKPLIKALIVIILIIALLGWIKFHIWITLHPDAPKWGFLISQHN
jgi:hypothetical protein